MVINKGLKWKLLKRKLDIDDGYGWDLSENPCLNDIEYRKMISSNKLYCINIEYRYTSFYDYIN